MLNERLKDERVKGTGFKFNKFSVEDEANKLYFKMSLIGKAKDLTQDICQKMSKLTTTMIPKDKLMKDVWSDLTPRQYKSLSKQFLIKTELVSKENESFKVSC